MPIKVYKMTEIVSYPMHNGGWTMSTMEAPENTAPPAFIWIMYISSGLVLVHAFNQSSPSVDMAGKLVCSQTTNRLAVLLLYKG